MIKDNSTKIGHRTVDIVFDLLANETRRHVIYCLESYRNDVVSVQELLADIERSSPIDAGEISMELHHIHLPKLDQAGYIDYHPVKERIHVHSFPMLSKYLDLAQQDEVRTD